MTQLIIKHFPEARWPWKTYFKQGNKLYQVDGNSDYKLAKNYLKQMTTNINELWHGHKELVYNYKTSSDGKYLVIEE